MQGTLFKFGITKEIKSSSGRSYDVTASMPLFVKDSDVSTQCEICNEKFKSKQYLDIQIVWKHNRSHKAEESKRELEIDTGLQKLDQDLQQNWDCNGPSKEAAVRETTKSQITVNVGENKKTNRKGSVKRKSCTLDFKLKTLGLLDKLTEAGVRINGKGCCHEGHFQ